MRHELFGELEYDRDDDSWTGVVRLPQFAAFGDTQWEDDDERRRRKDSLLPLTIWASEIGPTPRQEDAYRLLRDNELTVFKEVLGALFECYNEYTDAPSLLSPLWKWLGRKLGIKPIETADGLNTEAAITGVEFTREHINGLAHILFNVTCNWEPEHGWMIVYHKDRPATWTSVDALELESDVD
jgi:hypothetical protein